MTRWKKILFAGLAICGSWFTVRLAWTQGMATGTSVAIPSRPLPPGAKAPVIRFEDVAEGAGLTAVSVSGAERNKQYIPEAIGSGVAIFDFDNDGLPDIFIVNGGKFPLDPSSSHHHLYRNLGNLKFEDVTEKAGIAPSQWGQGVCAGDFDNDGNIDLFVT